MTPTAATDLSLEFRALAEPEPGPALVRAFEQHWPSYLRWAAQRARAGPSAAECAAQLRAHMPELVPIYDALLDLFSADEQRARFLSLYSPTPIIRACSQLVCDGDGKPVLVRNYDHAPHLCDGIILATRWNGVRVHALTDCLWGALDGVNDGGLVVALAFGGRKVIGQGFSASLIVRYLLQTCATVRDALLALARLPVYMAYNFTLLDRSGERVTAYTAPDRPAVFEAVSASTNHQLDVEWPEYARFTHTRERLHHLESLAARRPTLHAAVQAFLRPPLFRYDYRLGSGTLYTAAYNPHSLDLSLFWHAKHLVVSPEDAQPAGFRIGYLSA